MSFYKKTISNRYNQLLLLLFLTSQTQTITAAYNGAAVPFFYDVAITGSLSVNGPTNIDNDLTTTGSTSILGNLNVNVNKFNVAATSGNVTTQGRLDVYGPTQLHQNLTISGSTTFVGSVINFNANTFNSIFNAGTFDTFGLSTIHNALTVTGTTQMKALHTTNASVFDSNLTISRNAIITNNATIGGTLGVTGATNLTGNLLEAGTSDFFGAQNVHSTMTVTGTTQVKALHATNASVFDSNLTVSRNAIITSNATIGGTLGVTGATTLTGNTIEAGRFDAFDNTTIHDTMTVTGTTQVKTLHATNASVFDSNLTVSRNAIITKNATISGTLGVTGATTLTGNTIEAGRFDAFDNTTIHDTMTVTGTAQVKALHATNSSVFDSNLTVSRNAIITKNATIGGTLNVTGATTLTDATTTSILNSDTFDVFGLTAIHNALTITGSTSADSIHASNSSHFDSNLTVSQNIYLPATTTASQGVILINNNSFIHAIGTNNTFIGSNAGNLNATGVNNAALGNSVLVSNLTGGQNTGIGALALNTTTTSDNTAIGFRALSLVTTGSANTALGKDALLKITTGSSNIALGYQSGANLATTDKNNICIGNKGVAGDVSTIRIGRGQGTQTKCFISGIRGVTTGNANGAAVLIDSAGQLGTVSSSRRFKKDFASLETKAESLKSLNPVSFVYKSDTSNTPHFGLIAEEVDEVYPELVIRGDSGQPETVAYHELPALLIAGYKQQQKMLERQQYVLQALLDSGILDNYLQTHHSKNAHGKFDLLSTNTTDITDDTLQLDDALIAEICDLLLPTLVQPIAQEQKK